MTEIKFRAWDRESRGWIYSEPMPDMSFWKWVQYDSTTIFNESTGLKDKNGVEIYEGDVILTADDLRKHAIGNWKPKMRIVEWTDNKEYKTGFNLGKAQDGKCEVIGNIYENPYCLYCVVLI